MRRRANHKRQRRIVLSILGALAFGWVLLMTSVATYSSEYDGLPADCALVLGAAVWNGVPSPVYRERLHYAVDLYKAGHVRFIVTTGGTGQGDNVSEGEVGQTYAVQNGVPIDRTAFEKTSRTTLENLVNAQAEVDRLGLKRCLIVSDPLHLRRAMAMADDLGYVAAPAATPTTMYRSLGPKAELLWSETYYLFQYYVTGR